MEAVRAIREVHTIILQRVILRLHVREAQALRTVPLHVPADHILRCREVQVEVVREAVDLRVVHVVLQGVNKLYAQLKK